MELAFQVAAYFEVGAPEARNIAGEVGRAVSGWRKAAGAFGLSGAEIERMASAFEHDDLRMANASAVRRYAG